MIVDAPLARCDQIISISKDQGAAEALDLPRKRMLLSVQKGMSTPEVWSIVRVLMLLSPPVSQIAAWRSLILLKPVVAIHSLSPIQTTRAPYVA